MTSEEMVAAYRRLEEVHRELVALDGLFRSSDVREALAAACGEVTGAQYILERKIGAAVAREER